MSRRRHYCVPVYESNIYNYMYSVYIQIKPYTTSLSWTRIVWSFNIFEGQDILVMYKWMCRCLFLVTWNTFPPYVAREQSNDTSTYFEIVTDLWSGFLLSVWFFSITPCHGAFIDERYLKTQLFLPFVLDLYIQCSVGIKSKSNSNHLLQLNQK